MRLGTRGVLGSQFGTRRGINSLWTLASVTRVPLSFSSNPPLRDRYIRGRLSASREPRFRFLRLISSERREFSIRASFQRRAREARCRAFVWEFPHGVFLSSVQDRWIGREKERGSKRGEGFSPSIDSRRIDPCFRIVVPSFIILFGYRTSGWN